ncbi:MAG TPA: hypothetical protein VG308_00460 [Stellaceae bacterium]|jgi:hypothetical protein|nr:hypothetical protein [Stellaceae bacterium]
MKTLLSALAVAMVLGAATAVPANAACWATPYGMHCSHPYFHHWGYWHHWRGGW